MEVKFYTFKQYIIRVGRYIVIGTSFLYNIPILVKEIGIWNVIKTNNIIDYTFWLGILLLSL